MFFYKVEGHMTKLRSFGRGKTIRPKKSLTSLLHTALQLCSPLRLGEQGKKRLGTDEDN